MKNCIKNALTVTGQIVLLWGIYSVSEIVVDMYFIPLPANVAGMIVLILLLNTPLLPLSFVEKGAEIFIKHLGFFFIPFCVSLMTLGPVIWQNGFVLLIIICISSAAGIITAGFATKYFSSSRNVEKPENPINKETTISAGFEGNHLIYNRRK